MASHPDYAGAWRHKPPPRPAGPLLVHFVMLLFGASLALMFGGASVVAGSSLLFGSTQRRAFDETLRLAVLSLPFAVLGLYAMRKSWRGVRDEMQRNDAPVVRQIGLIVDERVREVKSGKYRFKFYDVTLQAKDGTRREYSCRREVAKAVRKDEIGVAYIQAGELREFRRFDV